MSGVFEEKKVLFDRINELTHTLIQYTTSDLDTFERALVKAIPSVKLKKRDDWLKPTVENLHSLKEDEQYWVVFDRRGPVMCTYESYPDSDGIFVEVFGGLQVYASKVTAFRLFEVPEYHG